MNSIARTTLMILMVAAGLTLSLSAQTHEAKPPSPNARIARFFTDEAEPGSGYHTGPLYIIYSDGTEVVQKLPPLKKKHGERNRV